MFTVGRVSEHWGEDMEVQVHDRGVVNDDEPVDCGAAVYSGYIQAVFGGCHDTALTCDVAGSFCSRDGVGKDQRFALAVWLFSHLPA